MHQAVSQELFRAVRYRKKIEDIYPDAFVIAVKDNKILPLQQALEQKKNKKNILNEKDLKRS